VLQQPLAHEQVTWPPQPSSNVPHCPGKAAHVFGVQVQTPL
jgi:hypothetical protein